jgi:hypothetical protein
MTQQGSARTRLYPFAERSNQHDAAEATVLPRRNEASEGD